MDEQFKFRAWDKKLNKFFDPKDWDDCDLFMSVTLEELTRANGRWILIQYTGQKDNLGNEIYVGSGGEFGVWGHFCVRFGVIEPECHIGFYVEWENNDFNPIILDCISFGMDFSKNIYEDPDLRRIFVHKKPKFE